MHKFSYRDHNRLILKRNNETLRRLLPDVRGVVYDLGCGIRPYEAELMSVATDYVSVDWSNMPHALRADVIADHNRPLPLPSGVADTVVSFQVLEHLSEPEMMLREAFRILSRGGALLLTVPFQWAVHEEPHAFFRFTRFGFAHLLGRAGFVDVKIDEVTGSWTTWIVKFNYQTTRLVRGPAPMRAMARLLLLPLWLIGQAAPLLNHLWPTPVATAGYVVSAREP